MYLARRLRSERFGNEDIEEYGAAIFGGLGFGGGVVLDARWG